MLPTAPRRSHHWIYYTRVWHCNPSSKLQRIAGQPTIKQASPNQRQLDPKTQHVYSTDIQLTVIDRPNLLKDILEELSKFHMNISKASTRLYKNGHAKIFLTCDISQYEEFLQIKHQLLKFEDIIDIKRHY